MSSLRAFLSFAMIQLKLLSKLYLDEKTRSGKWGRGERRKCQELSHPKLLRFFGTKAMFAEMKVTRFTFNNLISGIAPIAFKLCASSWTSIFQVTMLEFRVESARFYESANRTNRCLLLVSFEPKTSSAPSTTLMWRLNWVWEKAQKRSLWPRRKEQRKGKSARRNAQRNNARSLATNMIFWKKRTQDSHLNRFVPR